MQKTARNSAKHTEDGWQVRKIKYEQATIKAAQCDAVVAKGTCLTSQ